MVRCYCIYSVTGVCSPNIGDLNFSTMCVLNVEQCRQNSKKYGDFTTSGNERVDDKPLYTLIIKLYRGGKSTRQQLQLNNLNSKFNNENTFQGMRMHLESTNFVEFKCVISPSPLSAIVGYDFTGV